MPDRVKPAVEWDIYSTICVCGGRVFRTVLKLIEEIRIGSLGRTRIADRGWLENGVEMSREVRP